MKCCIYATKDQRHLNPLGNLLAIRVEWDSTVSKDEPTGYKATVASGTSRWTKRLIQGMGEAREWCEKTVDAILKENGLKPVKGRVKK